jgi:hypothetical protein
VDSVLPHPENLKKKKIPGLPAHKITGKIINLTAANLSNCKKFPSCPKGKTIALMILSRNLFVYSENRTKFINSDIRKKPSFWELNLVAPIATTDL